MSEFLPLKTQLIETGLNEEAVQSVLKVAQETLQPKKYGLVWEEKEETTFMQQPCFKEIYEREIKLVDSDSPQHLLIEGDNYEALKLLQTTHRGKVNVIYIDPPYNTGKEFVYNDKLVDKEDGYRHSKWLSFMNKRLILAKDLMSEDGVIFISIDDNEMAQLKLLCDEVFGEKNFIQNFMWLHGKGKKNTQSRTMQQYVLCYAKRRTLLGEWVSKKVANYDFKNPDDDPKGVWFSGSISFDEKRSNPTHKNYYSIQSPSGIVWERQWQIEQEEMNQLILDGDIYFGMAPTYNNVPRRKIRPSLIEIIPSNIIEDKGTTKSAENELKKILGHKAFDYPKPVELIKHLIEISENDSKTIILDFFAGSGTTGHAVLELNKEDGGNRQFILCTNNENNICEEVTYKRLKRVINGYTTPKGKEVEGLPANLKYLKIVEQEEKEFESNE